MSSRSSLRARLGWSLAALPLVAFAVVPPAAQAVWSTDPDQNNAIADRASEQVVPKIAVTPSGDTYVAWFDLAAGSYDVYLQRLDPQGNEMFPHNGILVSDHSQSTSLVGWDMIADSEGNAVLTFTDTRDGGDLDAFAYRIQSDGTFLWGPDGIQLSIEPDYTPNPVVTEASDGDFVFVWAHYPDSGDGSMRMQRIAPDGTVRFAAGGIDIVTAAGESPGFPLVVPSNDGSVIVGYVRDIDTFLAPRHLRAIRIAADGSTVWGPVVVYDTVSLPIAYQPLGKPDGVGGAVFCWHRSASNLYNSLVQHLRADGTEVWSHQGIEVTAQLANYHLNPSFSYDPIADETIVFWNEEPTTQNQFGIKGQKIESDGTLAWGPNGIIYVPMSPTLRYSPHVVGWAGGAMVFFADEPTGQFDMDRVLGYRVDGAGAVLWGPVEVSSHLSSKSRLPATIDAQGVARMIWEDNRSGNPDVYGQAIRPDGTLGAGTTSVGESAPFASVVWSPNPFAGRTVLSLASGGGAGIARVRILDVTGRQVRSHPAVSRRSPGT
ncbi:MAG: hypothetical protein R3E12_19910 [Candidatus Eisenbacteria bacterium]